MKTIRYALCIAAATLCAGCYEDEGNYTYDDTLEDISVSLDEAFNVRMDKEAFTYTITPDITTPDGDKSYLEYAWTQGSAPMSLPQDTISREEALTVTIDPESEDFSYNYYFRLYVKDNRRGITVMRPTDTPNWARSSMPTGKSSSPRTPTHRRAEPPSPDGPSASTRASTTHRSTPGSMKRPRSSTSRRPTCRSRGCSTRSTGSASWRTGAASCLNTCWDWSTSTTCSAPPRRTA